MWGGGAVRLDRRSGLDLWLWLGIAVYVLLASRGFFAYLTDQHGFRQTQTALAAQYLDHFSDLFAYQIPVLGEPWAVPFEFPLYQALVRLVSASTGIELITTGRVVGMTFQVLTLLCLARLCRQLGVARPGLVCAFAALAPIYVFWSRTFMIETTALFFALAFLTLQLDVLRSHSWRTLSLLLVAGLGAVLVKVTTFLPVLAIAICLQASYAWRYRADPAARRAAVWELAVHLLVLAVGAAWVKHTDIVKSHNLLAAALTSDALAAWNWGTFAQRLDPAVWRQLAWRGIEVFFPVDGTGSVGRSLGAAFVVAALFAVGMMRCSASRRGLVLLCLLLFVLPFGLFLNLHFIHNYYQCANAIFLCAALGLVAEGSMAAAKTPVARWGHVGIVVGLMLVLSVTGLRWLDKYSGRPGASVALAARIQALSGPDAAIVIAGQDWSPVTPFVAHRRALMLWGRADRVEAALRAVRQGATRYELYVACGERPEHDALFREIWTLPLDAVPDEVVDRCRLYRLPRRP